MKSIEAKHYILDVTVRGKNTQFLELHPEVTFVIGANGSGKSTLLEAIAIKSGMNPEGGGRNFSSNKDSQTNPLLDKIELNRSIVKPKDDYFLSAEFLSKLRTKVDELFENRPSAYGEKALQNQSHGESALAVITNRFHGNGLYILDEPEAALSPASQFQFLALVDKLVKQNSQFIIATHSPIILGYPHSKIYLLEEGDFREVSYEETSNYQLTKYFLNNREKVLSEILGK